MEKMRREREGSTTCSETGSWTVCFFFFVAFWFYFICSMRNSLRNRSRSHFLDVLSLFSPFLFVFISSFSILVDVSLLTDNVVAHKNKNWKRINKVKTKRKCTNTYKFICTVVNDNITTVKGEENCASRQLVLTLTRSLSTGCRQTRKKLK